MAGYITSAVGAYALVVSLVYVFQRNLMYHPDQSIPDLRSHGADFMKEITYRTADNLELRSWYYPASSGQPTVLLFHGNAGHIGDRTYKARVFREAGIGVLLAGYRGYGGNPGKPSEKGLYHDGRAALLYLRGQNVGNEQTVIYGESLGTGVAVQMASELAETTPAHSVILEAPYTTMGAAAASHYPYLPAKLLVKDKFASISKIAGINSPLLVVHGEKDKVVPTKLGKRLFEAAAAPQKERMVPARWP